MRKIKFLALLVALVACRPSYSSSISGDSKLVTYVGRVLQDEGSARFDWSGVTAKIRFKGTSLSMKCKDTGTDYFNVWIDEVPSAKEQFVIKAKGRSTLVLADGLAPGVHEVVIQKRTEAEQGCIAVSKFITDGEFLPSSEPKPRLIEFIGDSYTCGYGTESASRDEPFHPSEENCNLTYAAIAGRFFDADIRLVSHSGRGVVRNYDDGKDAYMPERYSRALDTDPRTIWEPDGKAPDIVVIYLGTNDFSCGKQPSLEAWILGYGNLLDQIRANYGAEVPVLMVASMANDLLGDYVRAVADNRNDPHLSWTSIQSGAHNSTSELGASWHPNYTGHRKVASCMIPYISTLTGWEMPFKAVE